MPHLTDLQKARIVSHRLTRNGVDLPAQHTPATVRANACFAWALLGAQDTTGRTPPDQVLDNIFPPQYVMNAQGNVNVTVTGVNDLRNDPHLPNTGAHFNELIAAYGHQGNRRNTRRNPITQALVKIYARWGGLTIDPSPNPNYFLLMNGHNWHAWDHWGIAVRRGALWSIIQTTTGNPLAYGCDRLWDEHLPVKCAVGVSQLHQSHIDVLNRIPAPSRSRARCVECGLENKSHVSIPGFRHWHQCGDCRLIYCPEHARALAQVPNAKKWVRRCGVQGCNGRTSLF